MDVAHLWRSAKDDMLLKSFKRDRFLQGRKPMSDEVFLSALNVPVGHQRYVLAARQGLSNIIKIRSEYIFANDKTDILASLAPCGWDDIGYHMAIEDLLGEYAASSDGFPCFVSRRLFFLRYPSPEDFGAWATSFAKWAAREK